MMTLERKKELRKQLEEIEHNGGIAPGSLAGIVREMLEELGPTSHAEAVATERGTAKAKTSRR